MNTTQLECFVAVAEQLNYAKAAEILHLSQPAVSKKVQSLEEELEIRLFERDTRHVSMTYAGKQFYPNAKSILLQEQNVHDNIAQMKAMQRRSLTIGSHNAEVFGFVGKVLAEVYRNTKDLKPDIVDAPFQTLDMSLTSRSVDIVIGTYEMMEIAGMRENAFAALAPSYFCCIVSRNYPGTFPETLQLADLTRENLTGRLNIPQRITSYDLEQIYSMQREWQKMQEEFSRNTLVCDNVAAALCVVEAGGGMMFMPEPEVLRDYNRFRYIPIEDAHPLNYGYFYNKDNRNPVLKMFRKELEKFFERR